MDKAFWKERADKEIAIGLLLTPFRTEILPDFTLTKLTKHGVTFDWSRQYGYMLSLKHLKQTKHLNQAKHHKQVKYLKQSKDLNWASKTPQASKAP